MIQEAKKQAAAGAFDTSNLLRMQADNNQKRGRVIQLMIIKAPELHAVLRPEQKQKLVKLLKKVKKMVTRKQVRCLETNGSQNSEYTGIFWS
jgi:hypothetical protein